MELSSRIKSEDIFSSLMQLEFNSNCIRLGKYIATVYLQMLIKQISGGGGGMNMLCLETESLFFHCHGFICTRLILLLKKDLQQNELYNMNTYVKM